MRITTRDGMNCFNKFKKTLIHARKIADLKGLAPECYWKEVDALIRCALAIENLFSEKSTHTHSLKDIRDLIPKQDLIFSPNVTFPEFEVTQDDEDSFDKEIFIPSAMKPSLGSAKISLFSSISVGEKKPEPVVDSASVTITSSQSLSDTPIPHPKPASVFFRSSIPNSPRYLIPEKFGSYVTCFCTSSG